MKVLVTGVTGQLGHDCVMELLGRGHEVIGTVRRIPEEGQLQLNLCDTAAVNAAVNGIDCVIHCAAWTDVDGAEDPANREAVWEANVHATRTLARACRQAGAKMVYISTDYVFDGRGSSPWVPDDKSFAPLNVYGQSKLEGELAVASELDRFFVVRTAWVFGLNGRNFIRTMIRVGKTHESVRVVNDQIGTPTYTKDLSRLLADMIETEKYGFYHATNEGGYVSWYDFCVEFYRQYGLNTKVIPVTTQEYGKSIAARPFNSRLDKSKLKEKGFAPLPDWRDAVSRYLKEANL